MLVLLLLLGAFCAPAVQATTAPTQSPTTSINCFTTPNTELKNCMRWKACVASGGAQCDNGLGSLGTTLKISSAGIIGTIPSDDVAKMTALTSMCVHKCAIHPLYARAHFPTPVSLPLRSPTPCSHCNDTQVLARQPALGDVPHRSGADDGATCNVRAHVLPRNRLFPAYHNAHCDSPAVHARSLPNARVASPALSDGTLNLWRHAGTGGAT